MNNDETKRYKLSNFASNAIMVLIEKSGLENNILFKRKFQNWPCTWMNYFKYNLSLIQVFLVMPKKNVFYIVSYRRRPIHVMHPKRRHYCFSLHFKSMYKYLSWIYKPFLPITNQWLNFLPTKKKIKC